MVDPYRFREETGHLIGRGIFNDIQHLALHINPGSKTSLGHIHKLGMIIMIMGNPNPLDGANFSGRLEPGQLLNRFG